MSSKKKDPKKESLTRNHGKRLDNPFVKEIQQIILDGQKNAFGAVNAVMVNTYWQKNC
jgi:hypothetical protein